MISDPDILHVAKALKKLEFIAVQDIFLTETAEFADIVLPGTSFAEKEGTFTNTERRIQMVNKAIDPPGQARLDWKIICDLATKMGYPMEYGSVSEIMDEIAGLTPIYGGVNYERLKKTTLQWPCPDCAHPGTDILHAKNFSRGKGAFISGGTQASRRGAGQGLSFHTYNRQDPLSFPHQDYVGQSGCIK